MVLSPSCHGLLKQKTHAEWYSCATEPDHVHEPQEYAETMIGKEAINDGQIVEVQVYERYFRQ